MSKVLTVATRALLFTTCLSSGFAGPPPNGTSYLSDLPFEFSANGWGPAERDMSNGEISAGDGRPLAIRGTSFAKGFGVHAASDLRFALGGGCTTFRATIGIDDESMPNGSVIFQVWADGEKLYESPALSGTAAPQSVSTPVSGRQQLQLVVVTSSNNNWNNHADWANAQVVCGVAGVEAPPPAGAIVIPPGDTVQNYVNSNPRGTTFYLQAGTYRLQTIVPKDNQTFIGQSGAVLSGATLLGSFNAAGQYWSASAPLNQALSPVNPCQPKSPNCYLREDLFFDDVLFRRVTTLGQVTAGTWYADYGAGKIYLADNPAGHKVEVSTTRNAFYGAAANVTIRGLVIEKYANPGEVGAVHALNDPGPYSSDWTIDNNEIRWNHGAGIRVANRSQVLRNRIHHNGQSGVLGGGVNIVIDGNEIAFNNYAGYDYSWDAGGTKFTQTTNLLVRNNFAHDNDGPALWTDGDNPGAVFENNRTSNNKVAGILQELGSSVVIRNNTVENDGWTPSGSLWYGAGIMVATSSDVEIYGNTVTNCQNGIGASYFNRTNNGRVLTLQNLNVHDNVITQSSGIAAGIVSDSQQPFVSWNNSFQRNTYQLGSAGRYYTWNSRDLTRAEWQALGLDSAGTWR